MKLHYPKSHYNKNRRGLVFPLLKSFLKGENFTDAERVALYGVSETDFHFTGTLEEADVVILTMAWNYYIKTKQQALAIAFVKKCASLNKKVIALNAGDFGVRVSYFKNLVVLRPSGYKSKFTENEYALPAFIADPLQKYYQADKIFERPYQSKPVIGFCGQANASRINVAKDILKTFLHNIKCYIRVSKNEPQQLLSTSLLRASVLKSLEKSTEVETNFILRKKYRAGITTDKNTHPTTLQFYNNLNNSDYVVCVRGAGNFSVRFYETLAMGRIPVFINTDCALPFDDTLGWKQQVVWVEYKDRNQVVRKVKEFHGSLSASEFIDLQLANRKLWKERLTMDGFFKEFLLNLNLKR